MEEELENHPPWLLTLIETEFYGPCDHHISRKCNFFCTDCPKATFCEICNNNQHKGHHVLQVYKASNYPGIKTESIQDLLFISDIQPYTINYCPIIYINQRPRKGNGNRVVNRIRSPLISHSHKCETCHRELLSQESSKSSYRFCSMECKVRSKCLMVKSCETNACLLAETCTSISNHIGKFDEEVTRSKASSPSSLVQDNEMVNSINGLVQYLRRRKRKGKPVKSPLF